MPSLLEQALEKLPAIVVATGPSFEKLIGVDIPPTCKVFACSDLAAYLSRIDVYALADTSHIRHIPPYKCQIAVTHAGLTEWHFNENDSRVSEWFCDPFQVNDWKHRQADVVNAGMELGVWLQTGIFTLILALRETDTVGLIGYDGFDQYGQDHTPEIEFVNEWFFNYLNMLADKRPRTKLVSLMEASAYMDCLVPLREFVYTPPLVKVHHSW